MKVAVFIDCQNDFVDVDGKLPYAFPRESNFDKVIGFARDCVADPDVKLYATRDTHEETKYKDPDGTIPESGYLKTLEGQNLPVEHCVEGDWGWNICDGLMEVLDGKCTFVNKTTFGSLDLAEIIREDFPVEEPDEIAICGYDLSICVVSNALILRAKFPNTRIVVYKDLCGDVSYDAFNSTLGVLYNCQIGVHNYNKKSWETQNKED